MQERVMKTENLQVHWNTVTEEILGKDEVEGVRIKDMNTGKTEVLNVTGFFVAIGHKPNTDLFEGWIDLDENKYIKTKAGRTFTNIEGVFASGDAQDHIYRQAVTAAGSGCMAALDAERYLSEKGII